MILLVPVPYKTSSPTMPAIFPMLFIAAVFIFISAHAANQETPKKTTAKQFAEATEKVVKELLEK